MKRKNACQYIGKSILKFMLAYVYCELNWYSCQLDV